MAAQSRWHAAGRAVRASGASHHAPYQGIFTGISDGASIQLALGKVSAEAVL